MVQIWNAGAEELWGLRPVEVEGKHFMNLDIGLPVADVAQLVRTTMGTQSRSQRTPYPARNRRGREFTCLVTCSPMTPSDAQVGVIILMD